MSRATTRVAVVQCARDLVDLTEAVRLYKKGDVDAASRLLQWRRSETQEHRRLSRVKPNELLTRFEADGSAAAEL